MRITSFIFFALSGILLYAQPPAGTVLGGMRQGKVFGYILDSISKYPVEYSSITLTHLRDSNFVTGALTNDKGFFEINELKPGKYKAVINFIGYRKKEINAISVLPPNFSADLGIIYLVESAKTLDEVKVVGQRALYEKQIDKKVFNTEQMVGVQGGTAADVLKNIPSVNMDDQGNLNLRNNGNVQILIDGKPSNALSSGLQNLPASAIEKVEVITNPSAKYDPDGTSGIVNIILKKGRQAGLNGNVTVGYGTLNRYNFSTGLNYYSGKVNVNANYGFRYDNVPNWITSDRAFINSNNENEFQESENKNWNYNRNHSFRVGLDYALNANNSISVSTATIFGFDNNYENPIYLFYKENNVYRKEIIHSSESRKNVNLDANTNYTHKFKKPETEISFDYSISSSDRNTDRKNELSGENYLLNYLYNDATLFDEGDDRLTHVAQSDFKTNLLSHKFETGLKYTNRNLQSLQNIFPSTIQVIYINGVDYKDYTGAGYFTLAKKIDKLSYKAGLRFESFTNDFFNVNFPNAVYKNTYNDFFPTVALSYEMKQGEAITLNYSRRTNRPNIGMLNPVADISNPYSQRRGNPNLQPEYINALELSYNKYFKIFSLTSSLYMNQTNNAFTRSAVVDNEGRITITSDNIGKQLQYGIELLINGSFTKKLTITYSANLSQRRISGNIVGQDFKAENVNFNNRLNAVYAINKKWDVQLGAFYNSRFVTPQGEILSMNNVDMAFRYRVFNGKGVFTFGVNDIFWGNKFRVRVNQPTFTNAVERKRQSRFVSVNFNYRFGKGDSKSRKRDQPQRNTEQMDMGM